MRRIRVPLLWLLFTACAWTVPRAQEAPAPPPADSGIEEQVSVVLIEFKLLVTDKSGEPVTDLRPEEVKVFEGGRPQQLAFVESWLTTQSDSRRTIEGSVPATVYSPKGEEVRPEQVTAVPPPKPVRRIVFVFDARNSRIRIREDWRKAAKEWVETQMRPDDLASVIVLRNYPDWVLAGSSDRQTVLQALEVMDLFTDTPDRSRRESITDLLNDLHAVCVDTAGSGPGRGSTDSSATLSYTNEAACAYEVARPYIDQWGNESEESILALRQLTGQLSAIPGRKAVLLFSEGIIPDPGDVAINAMLSIWGAQMINFRSMSSSLRRNSYNELSELHRVSTAADVAYFTLDSRPSSERGYSNEIEMQVSQARGVQGINPWGEMYESTRSTLSALAWATGGRPFYGPDDLLEDVGTATAGFYGIYNVGYYRSDPLDPGKLKVKVTRKGVRYDLPSQPNWRKHEARKTALELVVGRPFYSGVVNRQQLPVAVMALFEVLPLRAGGGGRGCQLGIFLQAQRPDGSVAAERFETAIVAVGKATPEELEGQYYDFKTALELDPGQYRLRARLSDEFNAILGDTFIDLTVGEGVIAPGFVEIPRNDATRPPAG